MKVWQIEQGHGDYCYTVDLTESQIIGLAA